MLVGAGLLALWDQSSSLAMKASFEVIFDIGTGTLFSVLMIPRQVCVHVDDMGIAAGIFVSFPLFGGLVRLSMCSTMFTKVFEKKILTAGDLLGRPSSIQRRSRGYWIYCYVKGAETATTPGSD